MGGSEEDPYSVIFSSLRHPTRRFVLRNLAQGQPKRFSELQADLNVDSPSLSYHLDALQGLVTKSDEAYSLTELGVAALNLMRRVEEPPSQNSTGRVDLARHGIAWIMVLLLLGSGSVGLIFTTTLDNPAHRWLYGTDAYGLSPGSATLLFVGIKYDSRQIIGLQNGESVGGIERPSWTPWSNTVNYASFSVYFQNGTVKYWLTNPAGHLAPDRSRSCNPPCDQYSPQTLTIVGSAGAGNTFYTEMSDEGNYTLHLENTGQGVATGNVTHGPARVVYLRPFFFVGLLFVAPAIAFVTITASSHVRPRLSTWRQRHTGFVQKS